MLASGLYVCAASVMHIFVSSASINHFQGLITSNTSNSTLEGCLPPPRHSFLPGAAVCARVLAGAPSTRHRCAYVTGELGVDACVDYKNSGESVGAALKRLCPNGVDAFFDNVGGPTLDAVVANMNCFGRIRCQTS